MNVRPHNQIRWELRFRTLRWLPVALALSVFLQGLAQAEPEAGTVDGAGCPQKLVSLRNDGNDYVNAGSLLPAKLDCYEPLFQNEEDLKQCSVDFQLKARREYGDLLLKLARRKTGDDEVKYEGLAADQYRMYLSDYTSKYTKMKLNESDLQNPRNALYAYADIMFDVTHFDDLCDEFAKMVKLMPDLFDLRNLKMWNKTFDSPSWPERTARLGEYCGLRPESALPISDVERESLFSRCKSLNKSPN